MLKNRLASSCFAVVCRLATFGIRRPTSHHLSPFTFHPSPFFTLLLIFHLSPFILHLFAYSPSFDISASSTNLIVTEQTAITLRLRMPGLGDPFAEQPPFLNQRPPHIEAEFLSPDWSPGPLAAVDPKQLFEGQSRRRRGDVPSFTLNNYVSNDIFSSMGDPFGMMDDDFFGRSMLGPRKTLFPFVARRGRAGGTNVWEFTVTTAPYRAASQGTVKIPPVRISVPMIVSVREGRDRFGRRAHVPELREIRLETKPLEIVVNGPPSAGRPEEFCGALSSNLSVRGTLDTNVCTAGDPLVFTLDVSGAADLAAVYPPSLDKLVKSDAFRVDAGSVKTDTFADFRRFTWRVRAVKAGTGEFPSIPVAYYDLGKRAYVTLRTDKIPIQVKAGAQATLGALDEEGGEADVLPMPDGIDLDPSGAAALPFLPHLALSVLLFVLPPLLFIAIRLAPPVRRRVAARNAAYRKATAFARCRKALRGRDAERRRQAIRKFFDVRYGVNGAAVTAADAERLMSQDFTPEEIALVTSALAEMDRTEYSARTTLTSFAILFTAVLGGVGASLAAPSSPDFTYRRASVLATRATDEAGFRAAAAYADCIEAGAANPIVFMDYGTCALMAGDAKAAQAAFRRAERWGGETPSTRRGLVAARARLLQDPRAELSPARMLLRPHVLYSADVRLLFAAAAWAVLWLAALLPPGWWRRFILFWGIAVFAAAAISATVSLVEERLEEGGVHAKA